ncbi:MAG: hypothetical protein U9P81_08810, partial [Euryarchaeota archaeon]|nr:hypothetical protein [Euryarchaeota archaeon]
MKKRIRYLFLMICLLAGLFISPAAGDNASDESNHYYYSWTGNNITNIMYREIDWQDCTSASIIFSRKYNLGPGDNAYMVFFNESDLLTSIEALHYTGTQEEKTQYEKVNNFIGYKYIGYYYITDGNEYGDGFCVDNIQLYSPDLDRTLFYDNGDNGSNEWILNGFTLESGNISSGTTLKVIAYPKDIEIEIGDNKNITWTIIVTPDNENKYWVYKNATDSTDSTLIQPPTDYQRGKDIQVSIDSTTQGEWDYTIYVNDTSGNTTKNKVGVKILESIPLSINISSHKDRDIVDTSPINVTGWVEINSNSIPNVTVNGAAATVQGESPFWEYSVSVPLVSGSNTISVTANTSNDTKFHNITVNKKDEILIDNSDGTDGSSSSSSSGSSSG